MGFGQYTTGNRHKYPMDPQVTAGRHTIADLKRWLPHGWDEVKKTAHNELTATYPDGTVRVLYHRTVIVTKKPDGSIVIDNGGYGTPSTAQHIMGACARLGFRLWGSHVDGNFVVGGCDGDRKRVHVTNHYPRT